MVLTTLGLLLGIWALVQERRLRRETAAAQANP
jgi:hypothetical protein